MPSIEITLPAVGSQPTQVSSTALSACHVIAEADDGNSNPAFMGDSGMATDGSEGIRLTNSATAPGRVEVGPFSGGDPISLQDLYFVGTEGEIINIFYTQW